MATSETVVEIIKFTAEGITEIEARLKVYARQVDEAGKRSKVLSGLLNDPAYARHAQRIGEANRQYERMILLSRNQQYATAAASGALQRQAMAVTGLNRQYDLMQAKVRNASLKQDLGSGAFFAHAKAMAAVGVEAEKLAKQAQLQSLVAEHGRLGGVLRHNAAEYQTLKSTAVGGFQQVRGFTMSLMNLGLQGTVEGARLDMQWQRLGRQIAAIAIPALDKVSAVIGRIANWFERLSGSQQDAIMKFGLLALAVGPISRAMMVLHAITKATFALMASARIAAGLGGAAGGAALAGGYGAGMAPVAAGGGAGGAGAGGAAGGGVAATAGGRLGVGVVPGVGTYAAMRASGMSSHESMLGGLAVSGVWSGVKGWRAGKGFGRSALRGAGRALLPLAAADAMYTGMVEGDYYSVARSKGHSKVVSALAAGGGGLIEGGLSMFGYGEEYKKRFGTMAKAPEKKEPDKKRRDVTPMNTALLEGGQSAQVVQEAVLKFGAMGGEGEHPGARGGGVEATPSSILTEIKQVLSELYNLVSTSAPRGT